MSEADVKAKAKRYLEDGRWSFDPDDEDVILVQGTQTAPYRVVRAAGVLSCNCQAKVQRCSHYYVASTIFLALELGYLSRN